MKKKTSLQRRTHTKSNLRKKIMKIFKKYAKKKTDINKSHYQLINFPFLSNINC